ncbi:hypothetical protein DUI87_35490 [Hirundo rustica rustica]|uniref:Alpha-2-macroglobulin bait region domain-containing protein n=1 Tax=Hirundo rustica rustica TaxID=333673 RepID=A0A3M0IP22_HIRRU|nr:hypothetical protein DUI87_35490 [Hirundo rustica rustica]
MEVNIPVETRPQCKVDPNGDQIPVQVRPQWRPDPSTGETPMEVRHQWRSDPITGEIPMETRPQYRWPLDMVAHEVFRWPRGSYKGSRWPEVVAQESPGDLDMVAQEVQEGSRWPLDVVAQGVLQVAGNGDPGGPGEVQVGPGGPGDLDMVVHKGSRWPRGSYKVARWLEMVAQGVQERFRVTMVTPAVLRLDTDELLVLEAPGLTAAAEASVLVQDFPQKRQVLFQTRVALSPAEGMMATATIKSGHIFVQTDKPIYTPGATVLCRLFTVGHLMQPVSKTVIVEVKTPDNVIIKQVPVSSPSKNGILSLNHNLPEVVSLGMWTVSAKFEDSPDQVFSAQFEVKEYVLPSFEVALEPEEKFLYIDRQEDFRVSILARYLYGKRLEGTAFVLFGVMVDDEKKSIPQSLRRVAVQDGDAEAVLSMAHLRERFPNPQELVGHSLYVTVTVITESGSDMVEAQRGGIQIVTSPYTIHFTHTPKYFKPGMPFDLTVYVTNPDQSPAPRVTVQADGFQGQVSTQRDGTARLVLNMPANKDSVPITVRTAQDGLPPERQASRQMTAQAYRSQAGSGKLPAPGVVAATELQPGDNVAVNFHLKTNDNKVRTPCPTSPTWWVPACGGLALAEFRLPSFAC